MYGNSLHLQDFTSMHYRQKNFQKIFKKEVWSLT